PSHLYTLSLHDALPICFRIKLYDGTFFSELEVYEDCPAVLERLVAGGHELYFVTARAERRRFVTETWLREKGILDYAKAVHLKPTGEFNPSYPRGRYDPTGSAEYKARLAKELALDAFCEDDIVISKTLSDARSEEHTSELQSLAYLVCRLL